MPQGCDQDAPRKLRWCTAAALALTLGSCTMVGPDFTTPRTDVTPSFASAVPVSGEIHFTPQHRDDAAWWKVFKDQTLDGLIEAAYHHNLDIRQAGVAVLQARAELGVAIGDEYPQQQQLFADYQYNQLSKNEPNLAQSAVRSFHSAQWGLTAAWELDFWGKYRRAVESADESFLASISNYDDALVSLTGTVASTYVDIRTIEERLKVLRSNVAVQRESLRIAEARFANGQTGQRDVEQAKSQLAESESQIPTLESDVQKDKNALSVLLGSPPGTVDKMLDAAGSIPTAPLTVAVGIPRDLLRRRPDIQRAEHIAASQSALIGATEAELYPAFSLSGTFGFITSNAGPAKLGNLVAWNSRAAAVGPAVDWNIFNYGQITNQVRAQDARFQQTAIAYQNIVLAAQREVEDALSAFVEDPAAVQHLSDAAAAARRSVELALIQYREGATDYTTVLTAQQNQLRIEDQLTSARGNVPKDLIAVYRALGGGWQLRQGHDFVPATTRDEMAHRTDWGHLLEKPALEPASSAQRAEPLRAPDW